MALHHRCTKAGGFDENSILAGMIGQAQRLYPAVIVGCLQDSDALARPYRHDDRLTGGDYRLDKVAIEHLVSTDLVPRTAQPFEIVYVILVKYRTQPIDFIFAFLNELGKPMARRMRPLVKAYQLVKRRCRAFPDNAKTLVGKADGIKALELDCIGTSVYGCPDKAQGVLKLAAVVA